MRTRKPRSKTPFSSSAFRTLHQRRPGRMTQRLTQRMTVTEDDKEYGGG